MKKNKTHKDKQKNKKNKEDGAMHYQSREESVWKGREGQWGTRLWRITWDRDNQCPLDVKQRLLVILARTALAKQ